MMSILLENVFHIYFLWMFISETDDLTKDTKKQQWAAVLGATGFKLTGKLGYLTLYIHGE